MSKYLFVVDTDSYSGNFEREMTEYVVDALQSMIEEDDIIPEEVVSCIYPTPGFYNDGNGEHFPGDASEPGRYPAYQSVGIWLERVPTAEEAAVLVSRAKEFCANAAELVSFQSGPILCSACRLVEVVTTETEIAVYFDDEDERLLAEANADWIDPETSD